MPSQTRNIGRIPVYFGDYDPEKVYEEKHRVTLYGSEFQAAKNNPSNPPLTYNSATHTITSWNVVNGDHASETGEWFIISNGTDAWLSSHIMDDLQDQINEIIASQTSISLSVTPSVIYAGQGGQNVSLASNITTIGTISSHKILKGSAEIGSGTGSSLIAVDAQTNTTSDITYNTEAIINGVTVRKGSTLYVKYPIYFGASATWDAINDNSHKASARRSPVGTYSITVSTNGHSIFFNVPSEMSITKVTVSGFDMPFKSPVSKTIGGIEYKSYESTNTYTKGTLTVVIVS